MRLTSRIAALERREPPPSRCSECGGPPSGFVLEFDDSRRPPTPDRCPACGRQLVYRLEFDRSG